MTLSATFANLEWAAAGLKGACANLTWAAVQGQPQTEPGPAVVNFWENHSQDAEAQARSALEAARVGRIAANGRFDPVTTRKALSACQASFDAILLRYCHELVSFDRHADLEEAVGAFADWKPWRAGIIDALKQCPEPLIHLNQALTRCWEEMADGQGPYSVSVTATATGQDIHLARRSTPDEDVDADAIPTRDHPSGTNVES